MSRGNGSYLWNFYKWKPTGPLQVGARDLGWIQGTQLHPEQHLVGRLFYPSSESRRWPTTFWVPHGNYAYGYVNSLLYTFKGFKASVVKLMLRGLIYMLGSSTGVYCSYNSALISPETKTPARQAEPAAEAKGQGVPAKPQDSAKLPVIIFSHGLTGNRNTYSSICVQLASQGYVVLAIEHSDGSASASRLAASITTDPPLGVTGGWRFYSGWASKETTFQRTRWRVKEVLSAHKLLSAMANGEHVPGLSISGLVNTSPDPADSQASRLLPGSGDTRSTAGFLSGRLDMQRVAVMGHSYGGATAAMAASEHPELGAAICLDPWWEALPPESVALQGQWLTRAPVMIIGSHDWNTPNASGKLFCGEPEQRAVLASAAAGTGIARDPVLPGANGVSANGASAGNPHTGGPGALLLVPAGSSHHSFDDVLLFFSGMFQPILHMFKFHAKLSAARALDITTQVTIRFLSTHLPPGAPPVPLKPHHTSQYTDILGTDLAIVQESFAA